MTRQEDGRGCRGQRVRRRRAAAPAARSPRVEIGALTAGANAGGRLGDAPAAARAARGPGAGRPTADHSVGSRRGVPRTAARASGRARRRLPDDDGWSSTAAPTTGCRPGRLERFYGGDHAGTWPYGLPELPGQRAGAGRRRPDRRARLLPDGVVPRARSRPSPPAWSTRRHRRGRGLRHLGRGQGAEAAPAGCRGDGLGRARTRVGGAHRHTPEIVQNLRAASPTGRDGVVHAGRWCRCRAASSPPAPRRWSGDVDADAGPRGVRAGVRTSRSSTCSRGPVAARPRPCWASNTGRPAGRGRRATPAGWWSVGAIDNLTKGTAGGAIQSHEPRARPARDDRPATDRESRRERDGTGRASAPPGVAAGLKATRQPDLALVVNDGPLAAPPPSSPRNRVQGAPGAVERAGPSPTAASAR